ncbi:Vacuolar protein sorting-associated protein 28, partial [Globisporangium splendens]
MEGLGREDRVFDDVKAHHERDAAKENHKEESVGTGSRRVVGLVVAVHWRSRTASTAAGIRRIGSVVRYEKYCGSRRRRRATFASGAGRIAVNQPSLLCAAILIGWKSGRNDRDECREVKLWNDTKDRRKFEDLSDLFAIIKTTEHLEAAYVRDAITPDEFKTAENALRLGGHLQNIEAFIAHYRLDCPRALERLVRIGVPATVVHNTTNRKTDSVNVAQTVQNFITLMDVLKLNIRAVDEIQPLVSEMMASLTQVSGLPPDFECREKLEGWLCTMNGMRASDELDEDQARQLSFDLERAYASFMAFLNK